MADTGYFISAAFHRIHDKKYIITTQIGHTWQLQRLWDPKAQSHS